jgi:hypothetical protein
VIEVTDINYRRQTQLWQGSRLDSTSVDVDEQKEKAQKWIDTLLQGRVESKGYKFEWVSALESDSISKLVVLVPEQPPMVTEYVIVTFVDGTIPLKELKVVDDD